MLAGGLDGVEYGAPRAEVDLMRAAGFAPAELASLRRALALSDGLAGSEHDVMDRVAPRIAAGVDDNYLPDVAGQYARLVGREYLTEKASIMAAIDEFARMVEDRTAADVGEAGRRSRTLSTIVAALVVTFLAVGLTSVAVLSRVLLQPLSRLVRASERVASGRYGERVVVPTAAELASLATTFNGMASAVEADIARREAAEGEARRARAVAEEATEAKSRYLALMSHELRTPMSGVLGMLEVLGDTPLDVEQRRMVGTASESARALVDLSSHILDYSKIEAGALELVVAPVRLRGVAAGATDTFLHLASAKGVTVTWRAEDAVAAAHLADGLRIRQIVQNLLSNAVKFTETGTIAVELSADDPVDGRQRVTIEVRDTGCGVSPEQQARLFRPYAQVEGGVDTGGTGLGLVICRRLAELMGGELTMHSALGAGTSMVLTVGLDTAEPADVIDHDERWRVGGAPEPQALLVEDHPVSRRVLADQIRALGFDVDTAPDGRAALDAYRPAEHVFVITDLNMPELDGVGLAEALRGERHSSVVLVGLSANVSAHERTRALEAGMDAHLAKPVSRRDLTETLRRLLPDLPWVPDRQMVEALADLSGGDPVVAAVILDDWRASTYADLAALELAAAEHDVDAVRRQAHRIKGAAAVVGATRVAELAGQVESAPDRPADRPMALRDAVEAFAVSAWPGTGPAR